MTADELLAEAIGADNASVIEWRWAQCVRAGYTNVQATTLAAAEWVDLHRAVTLLEQGCTPELAVEVLL